MSSKTKQDNAMTQIQTASLGCISGMLCMTRTHYLQLISLGVTRPGALALNQGRPRFIAQHNGRLESV